jgi:hypothetical protein
MKCHIQCTAVIRRRQIKCADQISKDVHSTNWTCLKIMLHLHVCHRGHRGRTIEKRKIRVGNEIVPCPPLAQSAKHENGSESRTLSIKKFPLFVTLFTGLTYGAQFDAVFLKSGPSACNCRDWASTVAVWLTRDREHPKI